MTRSPRNVQFENTLNEYRELFADTSGQELLDFASDFPIASGMRVDVLRESLARLMTLRDCALPPAVGSAYLAEMRANQ